MSWKFNPFTGKLDYCYVMSVSSPLSVSSGGLSLVNNAVSPATITAIDVGALANSDTVVPTSKAVTTYASTAVSTAHTQNTDTGTTSSTFTVDSSVATKLILTGGSNTFNITNGTAILDIAAEATLNIDKSLTVNGNGGTISFSGVSKTLTIEDISVVNQDLTSDASPTFNQVNATTLHTTTLLTDHIGEHAGSHNIVIDNTMQLVLGIVPDANDGAYLGTTDLGFSDLFLAEGAVINFDNGDLTLTQSGNTLTLAGGDLVLSSGLKVETPAIKITTSPSAGKVLTSDADGNGTWQDSGSGVSFAVAAVLGTL
jgi:hypothetical protein